MMYNFAVEIILDEEKIISDNIYSCETMYNYIREMFRRFHLKEAQTGTPNHIIFTDRGADMDMGGLGSAALNLYKEEWFRKYAKQFLWCSRNSGGSVHKSDVFDELDNIKTKASKTTDNNEDFCRKAISFDSKTHRAKRAIGSFMEVNGFIYHKGLGYVSEEPMTSMQVMSVMKNMNEKFSWLKACIKGVDMTNVGDTQTFSFSSAEAEIKK